jgi:hypothetical protein
MSVGNERERVVLVHRDAAHGVKDDVPTLTGFAEVLVAMVDDLVCAERADEADVRGAAHASDRGASTLLPP